MSVVEGLQPTFCGPGSPGLTVGTADGNHLRRLHSLELEHSPKALELTWALSVKVGYHRKASGALDLPALQGTLLRVPQKAMTTVTDISGSCY